MSAVGTVAIEAGLGTPVHGPRLEMTPAQRRRRCRILATGSIWRQRGEEFYRHYIALALERANGVQVKAAEMLGMSFRSFRYYAKKLKLR